MDKWGELRSLLHGPSPDVENLFRALSAFPPEKRSDAIAYALGAMGEPSDGGAAALMIAVQEEILQVVDHACDVVNSLDYPSIDAMWLKAFLLPGGEPGNYDPGDYSFRLDEDIIELLTSYRFGDMATMEARAPEVISFMLEKRFVWILPEAISIWHNHDASWVKLSSEEAREYFEALWSYEDDDDLPWSNLPIPAGLCVDRDKIEAGILGDTILDARSTTYWMPAQNLEEKLGSYDHEPLLVGIDRHAMVIAWLE